MHYRSIYHFNPYCSNMLLCSRCGFLAVNFNRSKVFCSFLWVGENIFKLFLVYLVYIIYICREFKTKYDGT